MNTSTKTTRYAQQELLSTETPKGPSSGEHIWGRMSCNKVISLDTTVTEYNRYKPRTSEKMHKTVNETYANLDVFILRCTVLPKATLKNYCKYEPRDKSRCDICQSHTINSVQLYGVHVPARNSGR